MAENEISYDEEKAVEFIRNFLPEEKKDQYTNDEILFVIDCIWDYYEANGLLDLSNIDDGDEEIDMDNITNYVKKAIEKDCEISIESTDIKLIIQGELAYEETIEIFDD